MPLSTGSRRISSRPSCSSATACVCHKKAHANATSTSGAPSSSRPANTPHDYEPDSRVNSSSSTTPSSAAGRVRWNDTQPSADGCSNFSPISANLPIQRLQPLPPNGPRPQKCPDKCWFGQYTLDLSRVPPPVDYELSVLSAADATDQPMIAAA